MPSKDFIDKNFQRLQYVRYADDFIIGVAGPRQLAEHTMNQVKEFLANDLNLELSLAKTKITHFTQKPVFFLGTKVLNRVGRAQKKVVRTVTGRTKRVNPTLSLYVPTKLLLDKGVKNGYFRWNQNGTSCRGTAQRRLINLDHRTIVSYYNSVILGLVNYYSFATNFSALSWIVHGLKVSCALTLALKYKLRRMAPVFKKFGKKLTDPETKVSLKLPSSFKRTNKFIVNPTQGLDALRQKWTSK